MFNHLQNTFTILTGKRVDTYSSTGKEHNERYIDETFNQVKVTKDVKYAKVKSVRCIGKKNLHFDFYEPEGDVVSKRPLIVYAFGGAYLLGWKQQPPIPYLCKAWARRGYAVASINYRVGMNLLSNGSGAKAIFRSIQDMSAALRYFVYHSEEYRIDPDNIFLAGSSAGAITSLHYSFLHKKDLPELKYLDREGMGGVHSYGNSFLSGQKISVKGVVNLWGAIVETRFIDANKRKKCVPVISFHGIYDPVVWYEYGKPLLNPLLMPLHGSKFIHDRLDELSIKNELYAMDLYGHELTLLRPDFRNEVVMKSSRFIHEIMKSKSVCPSSDIEVETYGQNRRLHAV